MHATVLPDKKCIPCRGGTPPLGAAEADSLLKDLGAGWRAIDNHHLEKEFNFPDFKQALAFVNKVGAIAEEQNHHPDILLTWGKVRVTLWTHKVGGLTENDFILAAKADRALEG